MQWRTVVVDQDNWVIAQHDIKEILLWSIQDRPWYTIRTYNISENTQVPYQLKSNNWTNVEINTASSPNQEQKIESLIFSGRVKILSELYYRIQGQAETNGLVNSSSNFVDLHNYLVHIGILPGLAENSSKLKYENKIRMLQDLEILKQKVIDAVLSAKTLEDFKIARDTMERLLFTNILL